MIVETTKSLAGYEFTGETIKAIVGHLEQYAEEINITLLGVGRTGVYSFSYEKRVKCPYSFIDTGKEVIAFIGGDDYVSTIIVTKKFKTNQTQESTMSENTNATNTAAETVATVSALTSGEKTAGLINTLTRTATYLSAATAIGFVGFYAWKKFGNKAE